MLYLPLLLLPVSFFIGYMIGFKRGYKTYVNLFIKNKVYTLNRLFNQTH